MISPHHTTDFYEPGTIRKLRASGAKLVRCSSPNFHNHYHLSDESGELYLLGSASWITKQCNLYKIPLTEA